MNVPAGAGSPTVGVLALQGDFEAHGSMLRRAGAVVEEVRVPADLLGLDALVLPGGESTTMALGIEREGLAGPLQDFCSSGRPVLATCAGMIILGRGHLGVLDASVRRNAFGRQVRSFEQEVDLGLDGGPVRAAFIRAPWVDEWGAEVEVLAEVDGHPVAVRQGPVLAVAFHPEIAGDERLHRALVEDAVTARTRSGLT